MPSFVVDVSAFSRERLDAIRCYRSQLFDPSSPEPATKLSQPDFLDRVESIHAFYGTLIGKKKGEAFHRRETLELGDIVGHFE